MNQYSAPAEGDVVTIHADVMMPCGGKLRAQRLGVCAGPRNSSSLMVDSNLNGNGNGNEEQYWTLRAYSFAAPRSNTHNSAELPHVKPQIDQALV